jgi:hypothetical protein
MWKGALKHKINYELKRNKKLWEGFVTLTFHQMVRRYSLFVGYGLKDLHMCS